MALEEAVLGLARRAAHKADRPAEEVVIPDFGVRKFLPTGERTTIEITPRVAGRYAFTCGMSMLRGSIVAED